MDQCQSRREIYQQTTILPKLKLNINYLDKSTEDKQLILLEGIKDIKESLFEWQKLNKILLK